MLNIQRTFDPSNLVHGRSCMHHCGFAAVVPKEGLDVAEACAILVQLCNKTMPALMVCFALADTCFFRGFMVDLAQAGRTVLASVLSFKQIFLWLR